MKRFNFYIHIPKFGDMEVIGLILNIVDENILWENLFRNEDLIMVDQKLFKFFFV